MKKNGIVFLLLLLLLPSFAHYVMAEEESYSSLFISIGDAIMKTKVDDWEGAEKAVEQFKQQWDQLDKMAGPQEQAVNEELEETEKALEARDVSAMIEHLSALSSAFFDYDKMVHPVDESALREEFGSIMTPALDSLEEAVSLKEEEAVLNAYKKVLSVWNRKESIVREQSLNHYGKIETSLGLLRIAVSKDTKDFSEIERHFANLTQAVSDFVTGKETEPISSENYSLKTLVELLDQAAEQIHNGEPSLATGSLEEFLIVWPSVEGEISTRSASLYSELENNIPLIASKLASSDPDWEVLENQLEGYAQEISLLQQKNYSVWDAALVMLREGMEALLVVTAMLAFLKKTGNNRYQKWIWVGTIAGVVMSVAAAIFINLIFSSSMAGANREMMEGITGIISVFMMIGVGIWLHQKSHMRAWNRYIRSKMNAALSTGSVISMSFISFLSIFREGAETILFYTGMASSMSLEKLFLGIAIAVVLLLVCAIFMIRFSVKIPLAPFFKVATVLIYALAFKILGVSLHALQLTNDISVSPIEKLPILDLIGFYPTWETVIPQLTMLIVLIGTAIALERKNREKTSLG